MKKYLKQLFCFHPRQKCEEVRLYCLEPETRIRYQSPFDLFSLKETLYECKKCGKQFYYLAGNMMEEKMADFIFNLKISVSNELRVRGEYEKAIEVLKF